MEETVVRLKITSLVETPEQIAIAVGIQCDRSWRIGQVRAQTSLKEKNNGWVLGSRLSRTSGLQEHIEALLDVLGPKAELIKSLSSTCQVEFSCVIYAPAPPALYFDQTVINRIARLGASLDIDLYIIEDGPSPCQISNKNDHSL